MDPDTKVACVVFQVGAGDPLMFAIFRQELSEFGRIDPEAEVIDGEMRSINGAAVVPVPAELINSKSGNAGNTFWYAMELLRIHERDNPVPA